MATASNTRARATRLLVVTQAVDENDPVLGFFHTWLISFAKRCESLEVVCLYEGMHHLPENVRVHSLGKPFPGEATKGIGARLGYAARFLSLAWRLRSRYEAVFVHMNQEYVLLGGFLWRVLGKKILLWRNHRQGSWLTDIAVALSHAVFCTSPDSYTARFNKTSRMPAGIDTDVFKRVPEITKIPDSILFLGRLSPVKRVEQFLEALIVFEKEKNAFTARIVGDPTPADGDYAERIKRQAAALGECIHFERGVKNRDTIPLYNACELYVNLTPSGSMDKTILEAMACETLVLVANRAFAGKIPVLLVLDEKAEIVSRIRDILALPEEEKETMAASLRRYALEEHSLSKLADRVLAVVK